MRFLDLGFGLTKVTLRKYLMISIIATPLRIFFVQFFLSLGLETALDVRRLQAYLDMNPLVMQFIFGYLVVSIFFMILLRKVHQKRRRA
jgi:uncharacterized membrane protein YdjX (TVP38/TMEM64 family)